jgi:hypothetical protein
MTSTFTPDKKLLKDLARQGLTEEQIYDHLIGTHISPSDARQMIEECKKENCMKQQKMGLTLLVIGSFICFTSCVFTMVEIMPSLTNFFLYGMTSAGVVVVFGGLVLVFEKTHSLT